MLIFSRTSGAARTAIIYVTLGALLLVWMGVWWIYLHNNPPLTESLYYWLAGGIGTGLTLLLIGFGIGRLGREATQADQSAVRTQANEELGGGVLVGAVPTSAVVQAPTPLTTRAVPTVPALTTPAGRA